MRTRSTASDLQVYSIERACYDGSHAKVWSDTKLAWCSPNYGIIADLPSKTREYKPVSHIKWTARPSISTWEAYKNGIYGQDSAILNLTWNTFSFPPLSDVGSYMASVGIASCPNPFISHYDRWMKVKPTMATRANLTVFLAELRDIKRMFSLLPKRHLGISSWGEVRETLRYSNDLHLNYNFGWKPFFADIINVRKAYASYEERLYRFLNRSSQMLRQRVTDSGSIDSTSSWSGLETKTRSIIKGAYTLTSNFAYSYDVPYGGLELRIRGWLDSLGLNLDPATLWQLVPWSFVVDWVVDVSGYLEQPSTDWSEPYITWKMAGTSVKYNAQVCIESWHPFWFPTPTPYEAVSGTVHVYKRHLGYPVFHSDTNLDADKIRLLTSLLVARVL